MRKNLLDDDTIYTPSFYNSFNEIDINEIRILGNSNFSTNCFRKQNTNSMHIYESPSFYIDSFGINSSFGDMGNKGLKNCEVFHYGKTSPIFTNSGIVRFSTEYITDISEFAFANCSDLTDVLFNNIKPRSVGNNAFYNCYNVSFMGNIYQNGYSDFFEDMISIGEGAFYNLSSINPLFLKNVMIENNGFESAKLTHFSFMDGAFLNNFVFKDSSLSSEIILPKGNYHGEHIFNGTLITNIDVTKTENIGNNTLGGMSYLKTYTGSINKNYFNTLAHPSTAYKGITDVVLSGEIASGSTDGAPFQNIIVKDTSNSLYFPNCIRLKTVDILDGSFSIAAKGFLNCVSLTTVNGNFENVYGTAFNGTKINSINVKTLKSPFYNLGTLDTVNIHSVVFEKDDSIYLGDNGKDVYLFSNCPNIVNLTFSRAGSAAIAARGRLFSLPAYSTSYINSSHIGALFRPVSTRTINNLSNTYNVADSLMKGDFSPIDGNICIRVDKLGGGSAYNITAFYSNQLNKLKYIKIGNNYSLDQILEGMGTNTNSSANKYPMDTSGIISNIPELQSAIIYVNSLAGSDHGIFVNVPNMNSLQLVYDNSQFMNLSNWFGYHTPYGLSVNSDLYLNVISYGSVNRVSSELSKFPSGVTIKVNGTVIKQ
jgi:hypothetical protein